MIRSKIMIRKIGSKMPPVESIRRNERDELNIFHLECEFDFERRKVIIGWSAFAIFLKDIFDSIVMFISFFVFWLNYSVIWNFEDFFWRFRSFWRLWSRRSMKPLLTKYRRLEVKYCKSKTSPFPNETLYIRNAKLKRNVKE